MLTVVVYFFNLEKHMGTLVQREIIDIKLDMG